MSKNNLWMLLLQTVLTEMSLVFLTLGFAVHAEAGVLRVSTRASTPSHSVETPNSHRDPTRDEPRAYMEHLVVVDTDQLDVFAFTYPHDLTVDYVEFQYYHDANGDSLDNDGGYWQTIGIDDASTGRGDVLLYRGTDDYYDLNERVSFSALGDPGGEGYCDYDDDGYGPADPVVRDLNGNGIYDEEDVVITGEAESIPPGFPLSEFPSDEFHTGDQPFDPTEWIFADNALQGLANLDLWELQWSVSELLGEFLVRSVATDASGAVDDTLTVPSAIPTEVVLIDHAPPYATITDPPDGLVVSGSTLWISILADCTDNDVHDLRFQYNFSGWWEDIDLNDDDDLYSDINGSPGFQAGGEDEIFFDDGDFIYGAGDSCTFAGLNGSIDTAYGSALLPLASEDGSDGIDTDRDGPTDEDRAEDPRDDTKPFVVYLDIGEMNLNADTYVRLRAVATDQSGHSDAAGSPEIMIVITEQSPPSTDVVGVVNAAGEPIDVWPPPSDGDGVDPLGGFSADRDLLVRVVAEDPAGIESVDLLWQWNFDCYPELDSLNNPWRSMSEYGVTSPDEDYPYEFAVDLASFSNYFGDGSIAFYPMAKDNNGNLTPPPEDPYVIRLLTNRAFVTSLLPDTVDIGEPYGFEAGLEVPPGEEEEPQVSFWFADRMVESAIDASHVSQEYPYLSDILEPPMAAHPSAGRHATLNINGVFGVWYADLTGLSNPTKYEWTDTNGAIEFGAPPDSSDQIWTSYNTGDYSLIETDDTFPYEGGWTEAEGGVPPPENPATEAYDVIATLALAPFDDDICGRLEAGVTENATLYLRPGISGMGRERDAADKPSMQGTNPYRPNQPLVILTPRHPATPVEVAIYGVDGRRVRTVLSGNLSLGRHEVIWDGWTDRGRPAGAGVYYVRITIGTNRQTYKLTLVR